MSSAFMVLSGVCGLLEGHQDMHSLNLMTEGMLWMPFELWMGRMGGGLSYLITLKVGLVVDEVEVEVEEDVVVVMTLSAMNVVSQVILLGNVVYAVAQGVIDVVALVPGVVALVPGVVVQAPDAAGALAMDEAVAHWKGNWQGVIAFLLAVFVATAGHLLPTAAMSHPLLVELLLFPVVIRLMGDVVRPIQMVIEAALSEQLELGVNLEGSVAA